MKPAVTPEPVEARRPDPPVEPHRRRAVAVDCADVHAGGATAPSQRLRAVRVGGDSRDNGCGAP